MLDMLICIMPKIHPDAPTVGPAVLKSHLMANGFSCEVVDFNIMLFIELKKVGQERYYFEADSVFHSELNGQPPDEFFEFVSTYSHVFDQWIDFIKSRNPRYIGLSLLSNYSIPITIQLSSMIRLAAPNIKIIWGGSGLSDTDISTYNRLRDKGAFDHFIFGDGEMSLVELMRGNIAHQGIDSTKPNQLKDMSQILLPNYDDIDWSQYQIIDDQQNVAYITGSRGCVKKCDFCNVYQIWPEYRFRPTENILDEMKMLHEKYGRCSFKFTDSLVNGSMKHFRKFLNELIEYKQNHDPDDKITWIGQWVIRSRSQSPEEDYRLMRDSGCVGVDIGIESFNQDIRFEMGKKFTDEDMWWCLDMLHKYKIHATILMITGYPTETDDHHLHTLSVIRELFDLGYADKLLLFFSFGNTMMIGMDSILYDKFKDDIKDYENSVDWRYKDNTLAVRNRRLTEITNLITHLSQEDHQTSWITKKALIHHEKLLRDS